LPNPFQYPEKKTHTTLCHQSSKKKNLEEEYEIGLPRNLKEEEEEEKMM
jgi:hypothetical protein